MEQQFEEMLRRKYKKKLNDLRVQSQLRPSESEGPNTRMTELDRQTRAMQS